jgi:hypothetical protein
MTILDFIKSIFKKEEPKEEPKKETASINELPSWLDKKSKLVSSELANNLNPIKDSLKQEIELAKENTEKLSSAELRNPNIQPKEKQFMQGNREAYVKKANQFLNSIRIPENNDDIIASYGHFENNLKNFGKSTARPYHILQNFFATESRELALNIKNLDNFMKELKKETNNSGFDKLNQLKEDAKHITSLIEQKEKLNSEISQLDKELEDLKDSRAKKEHELISFKNSEEFKRNEEFKEEKSKLEAELEQKKKRLWQVFTDLERPLKKFERIAFENQDLIKEYMTNSIKALEKDTELKIINILNKLKDNVENNKLDLKDKKKEKTIESIKRLDKGFFEDFLAEYNSTKQKLDDTIEKINSSKIEDKLNEINNQIEKLNSNIDSKKRSLDYSKQELDKININRPKEDIIKEIKESLNIELTLS